MSTRRGKVDRGGVITNLDNPTISTADRAAFVEADNQANLVQEATDEAKRVGGGGDFFQAFDASEGEGLKRAALISTEYAKKAEREVGNAASIKPLRMIANSRDSPFGFTWVLTERDAQAVNEGRFCPHCLTAQESNTGAQCVWKYQKAGVRGCGWNRLAERFFDEHGAAAS